MRSPICRLPKNHENNHMKYYSGALHLQILNCPPNSTNISPRCGLASGFIMQHFTGASHRNIDREILAI